MSNVIQITSNNFNGQYADITFYPCSGGSISLGYQLLPYDYAQDNYEGTYDIYVSAYTLTCQLVITCPSPTPTITPTNTLTPTPSTTPNALCPQEIVISNSTSQYAPNGTYTRSTTYTGGTFDAAVFANSLIFTGPNGQGVYGALYILQSGSTYYQLVIENNNYWTIVRNSGATSLDSGTFVLPRVVFSSNTLTDGIISSPTTGTKSISQPAGPDEGTIYISYPAFCPSPTPTPTPSITPTITPTNTVTPSVTPTLTPTPSPVVEYHLQAENTDNILAENSDFIDIEHT